MNQKKSVRHARNALIGSCMMLSMWVGLWWNCISLYADSVIAEWGITRTQFMMVATIMSLTNAVILMLLYGKIQEKLGTRKYFIIGGVMASAGIAIIASSHSLPVFYLGAFVFGLFVGGITNNPVTAILSSWYKKNVGKLIGVTQTVSSIAGIVFSLLIAVLVSRFGWRIPIWITVVASLFVTFAVSMLYRGTPEELNEKPMYSDEAEDSQQETEDGISYGNMFGTPQFYLLAAGYILVPLVAQGTFSNITLIGIDLGYASISGTFLTVALIASAVFFVPAGALIDRMGTKWMVTASVAMLTVALLVLRFATPSVMVTYLVAALVGAASDACQLPFSISVREAFGTREYNKKLGVISAFVFGSLAFGPSVMAMFYDASGNYQVAFVVFVIMAVIGTVCIHLGTKRVVV